MLAKFYREKNVWKKHATRKLLTNKLTNLKFCLKFFYSLETQLTDGWYEKNKKTVWELSEKSAYEIEIELNKESFF